MIEPELLEVVINPVSWLITIGFVLILGFIGNYIFNKTQIPSILWLLLSGLIIGYFFRLAELTANSTDLLGFISGLVGAIAIIIILFDGGINTDIYQLFRGAPRGLLLTFSSFFLSFFGTIIIIIILASTNLIKINYYDPLTIGAMLGAIVGGTSSPIVIPLAYRLKNLQDKTKMLSSIESILTDPICIVVAFAIAFMVLELGQINLLLGIGNVVKTFSVGIVLGLVSGFIWLFIMNKVRKEKYSYILTLAITFIVYAATVYLVGQSEGGEGAGAIACIIFGLVLGNGKKILKMVNYQGKGFEMDENTKQFHGLISFVIRTFFFVYLGLLVSTLVIEAEFILIGIIVIIILILLRYIAVEISTYKGNFEKDDKQTMIFMMPRGLAAAILAVTFGERFLNEDLFVGIAFVVILGTAIITTIGVSYISHCENKKLKQKNIEDNL